MQQARVLATKHGLEPATGQTCELGQLYIQPAGGPFERVLVHHSNRLTGRLRFWGYAKLRDGLDVPRRWVHVWGEFAGEQALIRQF